METEGVGGSWSGDSIKPFGTGKPAGWPYNYKPSKWEAPKAHAPITVNSAAVLSSHRTQLDGLRAELDEAAAANERTELSGAIGKVEQRIQQAGELVAGPGVIVVKAYRPDDADRVAEIKARTVKPCPYVPSVAELFQRTKKNELVQVPLPRPPAPRAP